jgi:hypothetical protein
MNKRALIRFQFCNARITSETIIYGEVHAKSYRIMCKRCINKPDEAILTFIGSLKQKINNTRSSILNKKTIRNLINYSFKHSFPVKARTH